MYRFPMNLATNYIKSFLNVGNQTLVNNLISSSTSGMELLSSQSLSLQTIFDPTINIPSNYGPYNI